MTGPSDVVAGLLANPRAALLAVDFDGTLSPIVARPQDARPVEGAAEVLASFAARLGGVAIISGRAADDVARLAGVTEVPAIRVLGHYGLQEWRDGALITPDPQPGVALARARLGDLLDGADDGVRVEDKVHSLAVHTRAAKRPGEELARLRPALTSLAATVGLEAVPGRYVIELRPRGVDKGSALRTLVAETGARIVVYAGDDLGDLPAYDVVDALRAEGAAGLTVASVDPGDTDAPPEVAGRADLVLAGPEAVVAWLAGIAAMLG